MELVREWFSEEVDRREQLGTQCGAYFDNAFHFLEQALGQSQELVIFVTEITAGYDTSWFVENFGCDAYFRHNKELLFDDRRRQIRADIAAAMERIEAVLNEKVRPALRAHGGEIQVDHLEEGVLYVKLLGQCAGCPSADLTNETLVEAELVKALPEAVHKVVVVQTVSDELWEQAKRLLRDHHL